MTITLLTLTGAYALVAALLAYLLILSRLPVPLKALATLACAALIPFTLNGFSELRGLPSDELPPPAFKLHWARVVEPNPLLGEKGNVFLWLEELDAENYPSGHPRAYQLAYDPDLVAKVEVAMGKIAAGESVAGTINEEPTIEAGTADELAAEVKEGARSGAPNSGSVGERFYQFDPSMLTFGEAAAPVTPEKGN